MMDINEAIMELQFDEDVDKLAKVKEEIRLANENLDKEAKDWMKEFDATKNTDLLDAIKSYYFKKKYLWRIMERLEGGGVEM
jgi:molecular chaperone HscB